MKLAHIALWVDNLEMMKDWYSKSFQMSFGEKYENTKKGFESYFLTFDEGAQIELMKKSGVQDSLKPRGINAGFAHIAISIGSRELVDSLTEAFRKNGVSIIGEPRTTGDGYYECVIEDPEGNWIEITS
jgi:lactoylglutathione lyase